MNRNVLEDAVPTSRMGIAMFEPRIGDSDWSHDDGCDAILRAELRSRDEHSYRERFVARATPDDAR